MPPRPLVLLVSAMALVGSCRRVARLDNVQRMAYGVKPAVVRVNAYATAEFRYPGTTIEAVAKLLSTARATVAARNIPAGEGTIQTGAGGSGSGFVIHPAGLVLTSGHVVAPTRDRAALERELRRNGAIAALVQHFPVEDLRAIYRDQGLESSIAALASAGQLGAETVVNSVELSNGDSIEYSIRVYSPDLSERGTDLALLKIERTNLPVLRLGDSESVRVGDSIWSIGYPAVASSTDDVIGGWLSRESDLEPTFNPGTITAIKRNVANVPVLQTNVAIYRGNSGGPAVDRNGEVVGISTWGHSQAEQIKFLVPINVAKDVVAKAGIPLNVDGDFSRNFRAALDAAANGRWLAARSSLDSAAQFFPNSPDVIRFRSDVERATKELPVWTLHPIATGSAAAAVAAAAVLAIFLGKRRHRFSKDLLTAKTVETVVSPDREPSFAQSPAVLGRFTILNGTRAGERLGLGGSGIRIGRERSICEIVLDNPKVSRLHAEVVAIDGKVLLIDRNSSNGTYVNDQKIEKRYLKDGDIIYFGGRNAVAVAFHS